GCELVSGLDAARLRVVLRVAMSGSKGLQPSDDPATVTLELEPGEDGAARTGAEPVAPDGEPTATQRANQGRRIRSAG
ncbi:MAG: hypothetical protein ACE1ZP_02175, partial [Myxococcota bacterium]